MKILEHKFLSFILHDEVTGIGFKRLAGICGILSGIRKERRTSFQLFI